MSQESTKLGPPWTTLKILRWTQGYFEKNEIDNTVGQDLTRGGDICRFRHAEPVLVEILGERLSDRCFIIDHKDMRLIAH